ncbi:MAG: ribonuclease PH [Nitrospirota bacterium]
MRADGREKNEFRAVNVIRNFLKNVEGSVLIENGETKVICTATIEEKVPPFLRNKNKGWITAEYGMLPRSSQFRIKRESTRGKIGGRTHEIQRLIGRSLRAVVDLAALGERTVWIDCDVIQADGGTRTTSITGAFIALYDALSSAKKEGIIKNIPLIDYLAAVSVGKVDGEILVDLTYEEDSKAEVDMNFIITGKGKFVEIQGTAESEPFTKKDMDRFITLARIGSRRLIAIQQKMIGRLK